MLLPIATVVFLLLWWQSFALRAPEEVVMWETKWEQGLLSLSVVAVLL